MKSILILAIEFAPYQTTGAFRTLYFTKYLEVYGIQPIVITIDPDTKNKQYEELMQPSMNMLIGDKTIVYKSKLKDISYSSNYFLSKLEQYFKIQDRYTKFWKKSVLKDVSGIIIKHRPIAILTSLPFFSQADLALTISNKYNLPLILDLRDNWSQWVISPYATYIHYFLTKSKERRAFKRATIIITVTEELKQIFLKTNLFLKEHHVKVIPNGFDSQLIKPYVTKFDQLNKQKIIISYLGTYYYEPKKHKDMFTPWYKKKGHKLLQYSPVTENWLYRSPYFFLKCIKLVFELDPTLKGRVFFQHIGSCPSWLDDMIEDFNLTNNFVRKGIVPKENLDEVLNESDFFLSTSVKVKDGKDYAIASKTFEYLIHKKPILSFTTDGSQSNFIENSNTGIVFNPDDFKENAQSLVRIFSKGLTLKINYEFLKSFERKETARLLALEIKEKIKI